MFDRWVGGRGWGMDDQHNNNYPLSVVVGVGGGIGGIESTDILIRESIKHKVLL